MWGKNVFFLFVRDSRYTKEFIDNNSFLSVSFLGEEYREALNYCGSHSGRNEDKIQNAGLSLGYKMGIPYIDGAIHGWVAQVAVDMPGQRLIEKMYPQGAAFKDKSSLSFTPGFCASMQTALCVKYLVGRPVESGTIFYFDLLNQEYETIPMV